MRQRAGGAADGGAILSGRHYIHLHMCVSVEVRASSSLGLMRISSHLMLNASILCYDPGLFKSHFSLSSCAVVE